MESQILDSLYGLLAFAKYFFSSIVLLLIFAEIYVMITPYNEIKMIRDQGKTAPAISFGGAILGFSIPTASAIAHSVSFADMIIWAGIAMIIQMLVFIAIRIAFPRIIKDITQDKAGAAILVASLSVAAGILNAASMVY